MHPPSPYIWTGPDAVQEESNCIWLPRTKPNSGKIELFAVEYLKNAISVCNGLHINGYIIKRVICRVTQSRRTCVIFTGLP